MRMPMISADAFDEQKNDGHRFKEKTYGFGKIAQRGQQPAVQRENSGRHINKCGGAGFFLFVPAPENWIERGGANDYRNRRDLQGQGASRTGS